MNGEGRNLVGINDNLCEAPVVKSLADGEERGGEKERPCPVKSTFCFGIKNQSPTNLPIFLPTYLSSP